MTLKEQQVWAGSVNCCAPPSGTYCLDGTTAYTLDANNVLISSLGGQSYTLTLEGDRMTLGSMTSSRALPIAYSSTCTSCPH